MPPELSVAPAADAGPELAGTQIVRIAEVPVEFEALPVEPEEEEPIEAPTAELEVARPVTPGIPEPDRDPVVTAGEVLRPDVADSVMLRGVDPELARMTEQEELEARVRWAIEEFGEAEAAERRAREEALDWTHTDENGGRWGISPGKIHLGSLTLPLPIGFGRTRGVDAAADERDSRMGELMDQAARGRVWESWERRGAAIRERVDKERAERAAAGDTTRSR